MSPNIPQDELLQRYSLAKAVLPDGLPDLPSAGLRERILQAARKQSAQNELASTFAINTVAGRADSMPATSPKGMQNQLEAANDSIWNIKLLASLAVMGLSGLLWWQFEQGTPQEQEAAKRAQPSPVIAAASPPPAPAAMSAATAEASASANSALAKHATPQSSAAAAAAGAIRKEAHASKPTEARSATTEMAAQAQITSPAATPAPSATSAAAPEANRSRTPETAPSMAVSEASVPSPAPALAQPSHTDKFNAPDAPSRKASPNIAAERSFQRSANTAQGPNMAAAAAAAAAAAPAAPSPAPAPAPADIAIASNLLFSAIQTKDAASLRQALAQGQSPNARNAEGQPALHQAVLQRWMEGIRILLAAGADRSAKNQKEKTAADLALETGDDALLRLLK